jgi:predicted transcriptional regulator
MIINNFTITMLDGREISLAETVTTRHGKYQTKLAAYLDMSANVFPDEETGDVEYEYGHVRRFGKRLLFTDSLGFVNIDTFASEAEAIETFESIAEDYEHYSDMGLYNNDAS